MIMNKLITRNRLATLTQRIKSSQILKIDSRNKFQNNRNLNFEFRSKSIRQRSRSDKTTSSQADQTNNSISENRNNKIAKLFLKRVDEHSSDFKDEKIYYNYSEKKHIINKCFKFKQKNSQINIIENF